MSYRIELTPEAEQEFQHELGYSQKHWGVHHTSRYRKGITDYLNRIATNPLQYALKPHYGEGVRAVLYKGNYIVYRYDPTRKIVKIIGFPSIHRSSQN